MKKSVDKKEIYAKKCIYLDQFAVSEMMIAQEGSSWFQIKLKLIRLHSEGLIFCPKSFEHYFETSQKSFTTSSDHDAFFDKISDGWCLKPELFLASQLISSRIRSNNTTKKTFMYENVVKVLSTEDKYLFFGNASQEHSSFMKEAASGINEFRAAVPNRKQISENTKKALLNAVLRTEANKFIIRLKELEKKGGITIGGYDLGGKEIPNWIDLIIDQLLKKHVFKLQEIKKLISEFETFGFQNISCLHIRHSLQALAGIYGRKETSSDHIDFSRLSTGLQISDYLFTDRKRKAELLELGFDIKYNVKIYSGVEIDLIEFMKDLDSLF